MQWKIAMHWYHIYWRHRRSLRYLDYGLRWWESCATSMKVLHRWSHYRWMLYYGWRSPPSLFLLSTHSSFPLLSLMLRTRLGSKFCWAFSGCSISVDAIEAPVNNDSVAEKACARDFCWQQLSLIDVTLTTIIHQYHQFWSVLRVNLKNIIITSS